MIHAATQAIADYFDTVNIRYDIEERPKHSEVDAGFRGDVLDRALVRFISSDEDMDVSVRVFNYGGFEVTDSNRAAMLRACNTSNNKYRFVKFTVDTDDTINVEYDFPVETDPESIGPVCKEIFHRMMDILDKCYRYFRDANNE